MHITIESRDELRVFNLADILYLQASRNYTDIHYTDGRTKSVLLGLSALETMIAFHAQQEQQPNPFVRLGRSLVVNTDRVELVSIKNKMIAFNSTPVITLEASRTQLLLLKAHMSDLNK